MPRRREERQSAVSRRYMMLWREEQAEAEREREAAWLHGEPAWVESGAMPQKRRAARQREVCAETYERHCFARARRHAVSACRHVTPLLLLRRGMSLAVAYAITLHYASSILVTVVCGHYGIDGCHCLFSDVTRNVDGLVRCVTPIARHYAIAEIIDYEGEAAIR